jgi:hypothetical protein
MSDEVLPLLKVHEYFRSVSDETLQEAVRQARVTHYPADVVIEPDLTGFDLAEFMRAKELAAVREASALEQIPKIRHLLARLDR